MVRAASLNSLEVTAMAPKDWSNLVTVTAAELRNLFGQHAKQVERLSWKTLDFEEFSEA